MRQCSPPIMLSSTKARWGASHGGQRGARRTIFASKSVSSKAQFSSVQFSSLLCATGAELNTGNVDLLFQDACLGGPRRVGRLAGDAQSVPCPDVRVILNYPPPYTSGPPYSSEVCPPAPRGGYLHPPTGRTACAAQDHTPPQVRELGLGGLAPGPGARALGRGAVIGSILRVGAGGPRVCSGGRGPCGAWGGAWGWDRGCICRERWEPRRGFSGDALYTPLQLRGLPT